MVKFTSILTGNESNVDWNEGVSFDEPVPDTVRCPTFAVPTSRVAELHAFVVRMAESGRFVSMLAATDESDAIGKVLDDARAAGIVMMGAMVATRAQ